MADLVPIRRALISVSDKSGLVPLAKALASRGVEIISTGGTATSLREAGLKVTMIDQVTGFPEIMGGRVKTLHPKVHGGLLGVRDDPSHKEAMDKHGIAPIDLVCVNLYPFEQTVAKPGVSEHDALENIDIGGPSMLRSAAKNFEWVTVITSPGQYERVLHELEANKGATSRQLRAELAAEVYALTSRYDAAIAAYLRRQPAMLFPALLTLQYVKDEDLRYGENPHQAAALYRAMKHGGDAASRWPSIASAEQLHGKELSYNNINDAAAALELVLALQKVIAGGAARDSVSACIVKHTNPCGAAIASTSRDAIDEAIAGDPIAAYGGILAVGDELDDEAAERLKDKDVFLEVIIAPRYSPGALDTLRARWANVRLLKIGDIAPESGSQLEYRSIPGGMLVQERDLHLARADQFQLRAGPKATKDELHAAAFLEAACRFLFSNAIVVGGTSPTRPGASRIFGAGAGQMDRVTSCRLAAEKAGKLAKGAVAFSDAFFPFSDGPEVLINAGVKVIIHPGGSKRDDDTFKLCEERGVTCLTTGIRHFRH
jgi:phosphoribosylaminoimidazolecarboxamide formyltransferase/IMP cyclohydrolase